VIENGKEESESDEIDRNNGQFVKKRKLNCTKGQKSDHIIILAKETRSHKKNLPA
jgi:hypothetical protein